MRLVEEGCVMLQGGLMVALRRRGWMVGREYLVLGYWYCT